MIYKAALLSTSFAAIFCASHAYSQTVQVTPATPGDWAVYTIGNGTGGFEAGPGLRPLGRVARTKNF